MKYKIKIILILIIILIIGIGGVKEIRTDYNIRYNLGSGDMFAYDVVYSTESLKNEIPQHIEMLISDFDGKNITTKVTSTITTEGNTTQSIYSAIIDIRGNLIKLDAEDNFIPEIKPELPNLIIYPENINKKGESWTIPVRKDGVFKESGALINYDIVGTKNFTWLGSKKVSVKAGDFECGGIKSDASFTINMKMETGNGTVYISTTGNYSGENWVDMKDGFLVKSAFDIEQVRRIDLSEVYQKKGLFENFYRETPITSQVLSELTEKKTHEF